ncbi:MAG: PAS domain S-box protein [Pyrinomonadaceae bacterium]
MPSLVLAGTLALAALAAYYVVRHDGSATNGAWLASLIVAGGLFFGLVLFFVTRSQVRARGTAESSAQSLAASETRFRTLVEQSPLSTQIFSPDGRTVRVNRAWEKLWGVTLEQLGDYNVLADPQLDAKGIMPFIRRGFDGEACAIPPILYDPEKTIPGLSSNEQPGRWVQAFIYPVKNKLGRVREVVLVHEDISERKRAEEAINFQAHLLDTVEQSVIATDLNGTVTYWNHFAERLYGWTASEAVGRNIVEVTPAETTQAQAAEIMARLTAGESWSGEFTVRRRDGTTFPAMVTDTPIYDDERKLIGIVGVSVDVTERKRAEEDLHESEERFRTLIEATFDGIVLNTGGRVLEANKGFAAMFGYDQDEIVGKPILELVTPECRQVVTQKITEGDEHPYEVTGLRKDGTHFDLEVTGKAHDYKGRRVRVSALRDITERKRAERALNLHSRVLENMIEGVSLSDEQGRILYTNPAEDEMFGYERGELMGQSVTVQNIYPPEENARIVGEVIERLKTDGVWFGEFSNRKKDGTPFTTFARITALEMSGRKHWVCVQEDITERKRFEDELRARADELAEANRLKDEFLATLSHELRTPLTSVLGWAKLLRTETLSPEVTSRALETIERNASMQAQLINDLLDVSRIITGKLRLDVDAIELGPVIEEAIDSVRLAADSRGVHLHVRLDPVGAIAGDADRLRQVFWNLLTNAIKFTPAGGSVEVRLEGDNTHVHVVVKDTGAGISPEFLPFIFDRFRQADGAITREHGGLGLGLAIARHLVELHGGQIRVESEGEGRGATFTVSFPLMPSRTEERGVVAAAENLSAGNIPANSGGGARENSTAIIQPAGILDGLSILVVDDDEDACALLSMVLKRSGASVSTAESVAEAFESVRDSAPDVLVSDIGMPGEDGYDLMHRVRALDASLNRHTPAAALTAYARDEDEARALDAGYDAHIPKPVEPTALVAAVAALVGRKSDP